MAAYYNEIDPYAAQWLRNLIAAGHIADGEVDERSIEDVKPEELKGFKQCHFFAGIGVWSYALRQAGWADDKPAWTGSCPCQPFSAAGSGDGFADERHLWPTFYHLIQQCKPPVVFGEQVASKDAEAWVDLVQVDLEAVGYSFGAIPFPAASVGAPHIRDRLYWVGDSISKGLEGFTGDGELYEWKKPPRPTATTGFQPEPGKPGPTNGFWAEADWLRGQDGLWRAVEPGTSPLADGIASRLVYTCATCNTETLSYEKLRTVRSFPSGYEGLRTQAVLLNEMLRSVDNCDSDHARERALSSAIPICRDLVQSLRGEHKTGASPQRRESDEQFAGKHRDSLPKVPRRSSPPFRPANADLQSVRKGVRSAPVEEFNMFCPVCAGVGAHQRTEEVGGSRVGRLRAYGNAIVAPQAQIFIESYLES